MKSCKHSLMNTCTQTQMLKPPSLSRKKSFGLFAFFYCSSKQVFSLAANPLNSTRYKSILSSPIKIFASVLNLKPQVSNGKKEADFSTTQYIFTHLRSNHTVKKEHFEAMINVYVMFHFVGSLEKGSLPHDPVKLKCVGGHKRLAF